MAGHTNIVAAYLLALLPPPPSTSSEQPWILNSKTRKPPASTLPPLHANIRELPPSQVARSPFHLDNVHTDVANLASLLATADDLPKSGLKSPFFLLTPVRVFLATLTPLLRKLFRFLGCPQTFFFLLAGAWIDPRRNALQSAEQWCKDAMVVSTEVKCHFMTKTCRKADYKQHVKGNEIVFPRQKSFQ